MMLSFSDLRGFWVRSLRNGSFKLLNPVQRGFYRACMVYARVGGRIASARLVEELSRIIDVLTQTPRIQAVKAGLRRAFHLLRSRTVELFPSIKLWLSDWSYIEYLGFTSLNDPPISKV